MNVYERSFNKSSIKALPLLSPVHLSGSIKMSKTFDANVALKKDKAWDDYAEYSVISQIYTPHKIFVSLTNNVSAFMFILHNSLYQFQNEYRIRIGINSRKKCSGRNCRSISH